MAVGRKKKRGPRAGKAARDTSGHLLDTAETLFAQRGFYGVSVRDITQAAGVDVSMINYHFGSKQELIGAVFDRRAQTVNADRLERLEEARRRFWPGPPTPEALLEAYVTPLTRRLKENSPGWRHYFTLVAEVNNSPEWSALMTQHFDPFIRQFVAAMQEALPECSARDLHWANHFFSGAITLSLAQTGRVERLSEGRCDSTHIDELYERLLTVFSAGFRALAATSAARAEPKPADTPAESVRSAERGLQRPPRLVHATRTHTDTSSSTHEPAGKKNSRNPRARTRKRDARDLK